MSNTVDRSPASARKGRKLLPAVLRNRWLPPVSALVVAAALAGVAAVVAHPEDKGGAGAVAVAVAAPIVRVPLPTLVADLRPSGRRKHVVRLTAVLEVPADSVERITREQVDIVAAVRVRVRELDRDALVGAAGTDRLRREIADVVDARITPARTRDVLFTDFLVD